MTEQLFRQSTPNIFPYVKVNLQSLTTSGSRSDDAALPYDFVTILFCKLLNETAVDELLFFSLLTVDESVVYKIPTIAKMRALYDNYELDSSVRENVTPNEVLEEKEFVNEILDTQVMQTAMQFLNRKGDANSTISLK